ncbi:MAG: penicillin acylase family protein [Cytophagaceae bacterium]|nr:penicillin acylase family protein [Cytophagaceae bacterium]MBL0325352.1 penicillin acylase family protein [Cytophagaceae bacterium]
MKFIKHFSGFLLMVLLIYLLSNPIGQVPPLGRLFSPFEGFLQNAEPKMNSSDQEMNLEGVKEEVKVEYDANRVPHIFAQNEDDLYFTQGYIMAKDRIWQMEFYTLVASGRLTEVVGERALEYDRYNRRLGMARTAREIAKKLEKDPVSNRVLKSFTDGVNSYIKHLDYKNYPLEYKILGYGPKEWSPYKTILMLMNMRNTLNGGTDDFRITNVADQYGMETVKDLFPNYPVVESPTIPVGTPWNFDSKKVLPPSSIMVGNKENRFMANIPAPAPEIGSNNWAVGGGKSATGLPILANDPHLGLTLPSIWYQMQLTTPDMNVYGVALPGCPGIVIGFNKDVAWGVTNVGSDVMDFYQLEFNNAEKTHYFHNDKWLPVTKYIEEFKLKSGKIIRDTLMYTHHGPIVYNTSKETNYSKNAPAGHAMRWVGNISDGSDLMVFYYLNRAKNYDDYRKALTYYSAPAQNFIFASNQNDISITPNGKLPLKWQQQGKFLMDGSKPENDWQGYIPVEQNPTVKNPPRGFVSSANQFPADPTYPYYLGWKFAPSNRAVRINERLTAMKNATADSLRELQNDNFNVAARRILPNLLPILQASNDPNIAVAREILQKWNLRNEADAVGATIYERWMRELGDWIWEDEFPVKSYMMHPTEDRTFEMIAKEPKSKWFDNKNTREKEETINDIIVGSFAATLDSLTIKNGPISAETWAWSKVKNTTIKHLVPAFASFSRTGVMNGGGKGEVNATSETHGPSWRMVVELDKNWPKAYGLYPGGQSGNPGSKYYDNMIDKWAAGKLDTLVYLKNANEKHPKLVKTLTIKPKK